MNKVTPSPIRRALTGVEESDGLDGCPGCPGFTGVLSVDLSELGPLGFGRRLFTFAVLLEFAGLSFGRDVMNAPRTSSSCNAGAAIPITNAQTQTNPKTITLNRMTESP